MNKSQLKQLTFKFKMTSTYPDVKLSRPDRFRETSGVDERSCKVEQSHWYQSSKRGKVHRLMIAVSYDVMDHWNTATHTKCYERPCTKHCTSVNYYTL